MKSEADKMRNKSEKMKLEADKMRNEAEKLKSESGKLKAETDKLRSEIEMIKMWTLLLTKASSDPKWSIAATREVCFLVTVSIYDCCILYLTTLLCLYPVASCI